MGASIGSSTYSIFYKLLNDHNIYMIIIYYNFISFISKIKIHVRNYCIVDNKNIIKLYIYV
jgi:hypothetical protein